MEDIMAGIVIAFVVGIVLLVISLACADDKEWSKSWLTTMVACVMFGFLIFGIAPWQLGYGIVPDDAENLKERLDDKRTYQTVSSIKDGDTYVLLVRIYGTSNFRAVRVTEMPPEIFTMVHNNPIAVK